MIKKFIQKIQNKIKQKKQKVMITEKAQKRELAIANLKKLLEIIKWLENTLPNRHAKRQFYRDFIKNGKVREETIQNLIKYFENVKE